MSTDTKKTQGGLLIWLAASVLVAVGLVTGALRSIEQVTWDWRVRSIARSSAHDAQIKIITIDQTSIDYVSREMGLAWPWPRSIYNPILEFLAKGGAKAVAFDLLFTERSNEVNDDQSFAQAVKGTLPVVNSVALQRAGDGESVTSVRLFTERQAAQRSLIQSYLGPIPPPMFSSAALPIDELLSASAALGNVTSAADDDQIIRHAQPGAYFRDVPILSLPFALYSTVYGARGAGQELQAYQNQAGEFLIRYYGPAATYDTYSLSAILSSAIRSAEGQAAKVSPEEFKDAFVLIGSSAPGLLDLRSVPFNGAYPGVEINATILDNLIHRSFLRHVSLPVSLAIAVLTLALSCFVGLACRRAGLFLQGGLVIAWVVSCYVVGHLGWWLPMVDVVCGMVFVEVATAIVLYQLEGRQHRFIRNAFKYYISPEVIERIVQDPSMLRLGGERRELSILFSDIQGFTGISERLSPDRLVQFLNRFLSEMSNVILETGGTLDKYQGDAVIAFWNAPLTMEDHRQRAVTAAIRCQRRLRELAPEFEKSFGIHVHMRVGIHTGEVSVGNFGSDKRFNYTMIGDAANVASRLEGINKVFGTPIIVSENTRGDKDSNEESHPLVAWRRIGRVKVVGRNEPITIHQPLDVATEGDLVRQLPTYHDGVALFEAGKLAEAQQVFEGIVGDPVSAAYRKRIERIISVGATEAPLWDVKEK